MNRCIVEKKKRRFKNGKSFLGVYLYFSVRGYDAYNPDTLFTKKRQKARIQKIAEDAGFCPTRNYASGFDNSSVARIRTEKRFPAVP